MKQGVLWFLSVIMALMLHAAGVLTYWTVLRDGESVLDAQGAFSSSLSITITADDGDGAQGAEFNLAEENEEIIQDESLQAKLLTTVQHQNLIQEELVNEKNSTTVTPVASELLSPHLLETDPKIDSAPYNSAESQISHKPVFEDKQQKPIEINKPDNQKEQLAQSTLTLVPSPKIKPAPPVRPRTIKASKSLKKKASKPLKTKKKVNKEASKKTNGNTNKAAKKGTTAGSSNKASAQARKGIRASYAVKLRRWVERHKRYPKDAKKKGTRGLGKLKITINRKGYVLKASLIKRAGDKILDKELKQLAKRASPFPSMPKELSGQKLTFTVPVRFGR